MTEETAKALADAMNNLANALNALPRDIMGIRVNHAGMSGAGIGVGPNYAPAFTGRGFSSCP